MHTLFVCARWGARREAVGRSVGAQLTPDTMVSLMLQSEQKWMLIESFVTLVMKTRELDGRAERGDNEGQYKSQRSLHPRSCVSGRTWLSASFGGGIFLFLPWVVWLVGLSNGRVSTDGSPGRTDDGRVIRDFKLETTARVLRAVQSVQYFFGKCF